MKLNKIPFKSYCWCLGTTSFRMKNFNRNIELQLQLLNQFWQLPTSLNQNWKENESLQTQYYQFLKDNNFIVGKAPRPDKDAREKTSGLVDLGLVDDNRKLTQVGLQLLQISQARNFQINNSLNIQADSFIYFKQLLKTHCNIENNIVRPFIILLYLILNDELDGYISREEFTYLLPLCINQQLTQQTIQNIVDIRSNRKTIDDAIMDIILTMDNYQQAKTMLQNNTITQQLICTIGINRKSRKYDSTYYPLYKDLYELYINNNTSIIKQLLQHLDKIKLKTSWRKTLFNTANKKTIINDTLNSLQQNAFTGAKSEKEFKNAFFYTMHLLKAKSTLHDYYDLNKRYLSTADVILFQDDKIYLDVIPKQFFANCIQQLYQSAFTPDSNLTKDCTLTDISPALDIKDETIIKSLEAEYHTQLNNINEAMSFVETKRYERFNQLINSKFTDEQLIHILTLLEHRNDSELFDLVTDNADAPTIFEYILGILWYKISGRQGKILDYIKLSLDADLLPKTHAAGGEADIVYLYDNTQHYPQHALLLEATLADRNNQRRMEMEPVSRHLGSHLIENKNPNSYCIFVTNSLNPNVISDFRQRKIIPYYNPNNPEEYVNGMKIIPLETQDLKNIILQNKQYNELYNTFENAYQDQQYINPYQWWLNCIRQTLKPQTT